MRRVNFDLCPLGMISNDAAGDATAKKRTSVITNSTVSANALMQRQRDGSHRHVWLENGRPKACEKYLDKFWQVVFAAIAKESKDIARTETVRADKV